MLLLPDNNIIIGFTIFSFSFFFSQDEDDKIERTSVTACARRRRRWRLAVVVGKQIPKSIQDY
jgi:hypothetical protein